MTDRIKLVFEIDGEDEPMEFVIAEAERIKPIMYPVGDTNLFANETWPAINMMMFGILSPTANFPHGGKLQNLILTSHGCGAFEWPEDEANEE